MDIVATALVPAGTAQVRAYGSTSSRDLNPANDAALASLTVTGSGTTQTYSTGSVAVAIPDNTTVEVPLSVPDEGTVVGGVKVGVRLNHTFDSDLTLTLVSPTGRTVVLANRRGGSSDNYGSGANDCSGALTIFDDAATTAIGAGTPPFAGTFKPEQPLQTIAPGVSDGQWKLRVRDSVGGDTGTLGCFQLTLARK